jgi:hypothetical protein
MQRVGRPVLQAAGCAHTRARRHESWHRARPGQRHVNRSRQRSTYLSVKICNAEPCYLGATVYGTEQKVKKLRLSHLKV